MNNLEIKTEIYFADEGTATYEKFLVMGGIVIGKIIPSKFNNFRYKEIFEGAIVIDKE